VITYHVNVIAAAWRRQAKFWEKRKALSAELKAEEERLGPQPQTQITSSMQGRMRGSHGR
jgi:hypothetical protein